MSSKDAWVGAGSGEMPSLALSMVPHGLGVIGAMVGGVPVVVVGFGGFWHDKLTGKDRGILLMAGAVGLVAAGVLFASMGMAPSAGA